MVKSGKKHSRKTPARQAFQTTQSEPNKIGVSTPYDFEGKNLTPYGGLLPVVKHIPGHGRATADSHRKLPVVEDIPELVVIDVPSSGVGPLQTRSIGEIVTAPTAGAIAGAVMNAIGGEIHRIPMTPERVLAAIEEAR